MNKKILTIGIVSMFLLTGFMVGAAVAEKTPQASNTQTNDLELNIVVETINFGVPKAIKARVKNTGDEEINGPVTITLDIKKGFFGLRNFDTMELTVISEGDSLEPGEFVDSGKWYPNPSIFNSFYVFNYNLNFDDENLENNMDSTRFLILFRHMFQI